MRQRWTDKKEEKKVKRDKVKREGSRLSVVINKTHTSNYKVQV